jgi:multiple sugar transport system permease protein
MATMWQFLLHPRLGPVNAVLSSLGFDRIPFLSEPRLVIPTLAAIGIWQLIGFKMVPVPRGPSRRSCARLYEAAEVDGASHPVDRFLKVTWPLLGPTDDEFVTITTFITAFKVFDSVAGDDARRAEWATRRPALRGVPGRLPVTSPELRGDAHAVTWRFTLGILPSLQSILLDRRVHY